MAEIEAKSLIEHTIRVQTQMEEQRRMTEDQWLDVAELLEPRREVMSPAFYEGEEGGKVGSEIYDGSAIAAHRVWTNGMQGSMLGPTMDWFQFRMRDRMINQIREVKIWMRECEEELFHTFRRSNFYDSLGEFIGDGGGIGTATLYHEEDVENRTINYSTRHPYEIFIAERLGKVDVVHRKYIMRAREVVSYFGKENCPKQVNWNAINAPLHKYTVLHRVFKNDDYIPTGYEHRFNKKWRSIYLLLDEQHLLDLGGYDDFPYAVWRTTKNSNEVYGRSPGSDAIYDIEKLNMMGKTTLEMAQIAVKPPLQMSESLRGRVEYRPAGMTYLRGNEQVAEMPIHPDFPISLELIADTREVIQNHYQVKLFLMLLDVSSRQMTATEIIERAGEKAIILGTWVSRLESEVLDKLVTATFWQEQRAGRLPEPPGIIQDMGADLDIEYQGPLAKAQQRLFQTSGRTQALEAIWPIFDRMPNAMHNFNWDRITRKMAEEHGMPPDEILGDREVAAIRQMVQKQQQAELMMQNMERGAEAYPKLAEKPEPGSPAEAGMKALAEATGSPIAMTPEQAGALA